MHQNNIPLTPPYVWNGNINDNKRRTLIYVISLQHFCVLQHIIFTDSIFCLILISPWNPSLWYNSDCLWSITFDIEREMKNRAERVNSYNLLKSLVFLLSCTNLLFLFTITTDNVTETPGFLSGGKVSLSFVHMISYASYAQLGLIPVKVSPCLLASRRCWGMMQEISFRWDSQVPSVLYTKIFTNLWGGSEHCHIKVRILVLFLGWHFMFG